MDKLNSLLRQLFSVEVNNILNNIGKYSSQVCISKNFKNSIVDSVYKDLCELWMQSIKLENQYIIRTKGVQYKWKIFDFFFENEGYRYSFFKKYKPLLEISNRIINQVESFISSFIDYMIDDFNELKLTFGVNSLNVGEFEFLGDRHFGGQRTLRVNLDDVDIIFKPRSTTPESFLNCVVALTELDKYKVLEKEDHGWCQYLPHDDIEVNESLHFYLGAMQALAHVTSTKDTHKENIVIHNSKPYLIDAECTISCSMDITNNRFYYSNNIYDYGIIPFYWKDVDYCNRNVSYLGGVYSRLKLYNEDINLWRHEFLDGFISTYTRLINQLDYFECMVNHYSNNLNSRIVLRNTSFYSSLLKLIHNPVYMSKDLMSIELELKARLYRKGVSQEIISCEVDALLNNDIPYFYSPVCQNFIACHSDKKINIPFKNNLFNVFSNSINKKNLNLQMKKQVGIINIYFDAECFQRKGNNNGNII